MQKQKYLISVHIPVLRVVTSATVMKVLKIVRVARIATQKKNYQDLNKSLPIENSYI